MEGVDGSEKGRGEGFGEVWEVLVERNEGDLEAYEEPVKGEVQRKAFFAKYFIRDVKDEILFSQ